MKTEKDVEKFFIDISKQLAKKAIPVLEIEDKKLKEEMMVNFVNGYFTLACESLAKTITFMGMDEPEIDDMLRLIKGIIMGSRKDFEESAPALVAAARMMGMKI